MDLETASRDTELPKQKPEPTQWEVYKELQLIKLNILIKRKARRGGTRLDMSWLTSELLAEQRKLRKSHAQSMGGEHIY